MRLSPVFSGRAELMKAGFSQVYYLIAESTCPPGRRSFSARKLGLIPITLVAACMATRASLCAGQMIRQLLCRGNSRRCWSTNTRRTSP